MLYNPRGDCVTMFGGVSSQVGYMVPCYVILGSEVIYDPMARYTRDWGRVECDSIKDLSEYWEDRINGDESCKIRIALQ